MLRVHNAKMVARFGLVLGRKMLESCFGLFFDSRIYLDIDRNLLLLVFQEGLDEESERVVEIDY